MAASIVLIKRFLYRGDANEEWSNKYYLDGADPADASEWMDIFTPLAAAEKLLYSSGTEIVRAYGYTSDSSTASSVWSKDLIAAGPTIAGTLTSGAREMSGDQASLVWWKTSRFTSSGKPIYLRKFFHGGRLATSPIDNIDSTYKTALETFATLLSSGAGVDGRHLRGPNQTTETIFDSGASDYVTTRTLKRRGRRPTPAP